MTKMAIMVSVLPALRLIRIEFFERNIETDEFTKKVGHQDFVEDEAESLIAHMQVALTLLRKGN